MESNIRHYCTLVAQKKGNTEPGRWVLVHPEATPFGFTDETGTLPITCILFRHKYLRNSL